MSAQPCSSPDECSYVCCAPLVLLLSWSFITSPSPAQSFDGSVCKELGYIHPKGTCAFAPLLLSLVLSF